MSRLSSLRHVLLLVAACACWGCGTVLSKQVLNRGVAPLTLLAIELTTSCLFLLMCVILLRVPRAWSPVMRRLAVLGVLNPGLAYALGLLGLISVTASLSVLLWATEPVLITLLGLVVLRERIATAAAIAVAVALGGVFLVVGNPGASGDFLGVGLTMLAMLAYATYAVLTRKLLLDDTSLVVVLLQQCVALIFAVAAVSFLTSSGVSSLGLPTGVTTWALAAASGVVYYGLAFWLFVSGLRGVSLSLAGSVLPAIPVFGLGAGYLAGDRLADRQWLGAALVIVATAVAVLSQMRHEIVATIHSCS